MKPNIYEDGIFEYHYLNYHITLEWRRIYKSDSKIFIFKEHLGNFVYSV